MINIYAAIMTKIAGSALSTDVGGRVYHGEAPQGTVYPYVVFSKVTGSDVSTFTEKIDEMVIQFSLFSTSKGLTEIATMYDHLRSLFDDAVFAITGDTLLRCVYQNSTEITEGISTPEGNKSLRHWPVEYLMTVEAS